LFGPLWLVSLGLAYALVRPVFGVTIIFSAVSTLYILLPVFFYRGDARFFSTLLVGCGLATIGFWLGLTGSNGFQELRFESPEAAPLHARRALHAAMLTAGVGATGLAIVNPGFLSQVGTYEGRVAFQSERGLEPFLLNQMVVGLGVLVLLALEQRRWIVAVGGSALGVGWALYSSHKLSLLTTLAAWFAWWTAGVWHGRHSARPAWIGVMLLPMILPVLLLYSFFRAGVVSGPIELVTMWLASVDRLGDGGLMVGDFDGPYQVIVSTLEGGDDGRALLGWTYLSQFSVLLPRVFRGDFADLAEQFAQFRLGSAWQPGLGFAFSPWAEGILNFGVLGILVEGLLFGLLAAALMRVGRATFGSASLVLYCVVPQIVLFQRGYLAGSVKNVIVYVAPFASVWLMMRWFDRVVSTASTGSAPRESAATLLAEQP
jgi:hypothetical protein